LVSVSDLRDFIRCRRIPWFSRKIGIKKPNVGFREGVKFHLLTHSLAEHIHKVFSLSLPGKLVDTEVTLVRGNLIGRVDIIRRVESGYIIQDEKFKDPPREGRVYLEDKLQLDAYAYLDEASPYRPLVCGIIIYNDLIPREVKLEAWRAKETLDDLMNLLKSDRLPNIKYNIKCQSCHYYPLCQVLPEVGGPTANTIKVLPQILERFVGVTEGYEA